MISARSTIIIPIDYALKSVVGNTVPQRQRSRRKNSYQLSLLAPYQLLPQPTASEEDHLLVNREGGDMAVHSDDRHTSPSHAFVPAVSAYGSGFGEIGHASSYYGGGGGGSISHQTSQSSLGTRSVKKSSTVKQNAKRSVAKSMNELPHVSENAHAGNEDPRPRSHFTTRFVPSDLHENCSGLQPTVERPKGFERGSAAHGEDSNSNFAARNERLAEFHRCQTRSLLLFCTASRLSYFQL
jgi:hypothetical protein